MTNTKLLEDRIKQSGKKKKYLAAKCGLSYAGLRNCILNRAEFRASHIQVLCDELGITNAKDKEAIFFAQSGALKAQR